MSDPKSDKDESPANPIEAGETAPTQEELVEQIKESDESDSGPNEALRENIKRFSHAGPIFASVFHAVLGACFIPAILAFLGFLLYPAFDFSLVNAVLRRGLMETWLPLFIGLALIRSLRPGNLAICHFGWSPLLCAGLSQSLKALVWIWLPLRFLVLGFETLNGGEWNDSAGRILFIVGMLGFTFGVWQSSTAVRRWLDKSESSPPWYGGIRTLFLRFTPALPLSVAVLSVVGFHFTAVEMSWRAMWTLLLAIGSAILAGLASRLLLITQFRIKLRQLSRDDEGDISNHESIDISAISGQVNQLIDATAMIAMILLGWQLWAEVTPAIHFLDKIEVWHSMTESIDGLDSWITLRHLIMGVGVLLITYILSRNLPGLLEITLLDRLPLDRGGRYAISFVLRYIVIAGGILVTFQMIGFSWAKMQWLAAGLTVGLGFGLQEIFANVVSGIIILIERPIRVGDVVTVNGTTGTVTRMQLRATTITDWDYRELIVPNKKFITEDVLNWTLSDDRSRVVIRVGVAYGSDLELVRSTLMKIARRHPLVSRDPEPGVVFQDFGDSTLNFELRVVVASRSVRVQVLHELNMTVDRIFAEKKIEIAFPQQDIFIKNLDAIPDAPLPTKKAG